MYSCLLSSMDVVAAPCPNLFLFACFFLSWHSTGWIYVGKNEDKFPGKVIDQEIRNYNLEDTVRICNPLVIINIVSIFWLFWDWFIWWFCTLYTEIFAQKLFWFLILYIFQIEALNHCVTFIHSLVELSYILVDIGKQLFCMCEAALFSIPFTYLFITFLLISFWWGVYI